MVNRRGQDSSFNHPGGGADAVPTILSDINQQVIRAKKGEGLETLTLRKDDNGNSRIFGFKIPDELVPVVETALPNAILWLQNIGSEFSYDKTLWAAQKFLKISDPEKAHGIAKAAGLAARGILIGSKPALEAYYIAKDYAQKRKELFTKVKPVIEATGVDYKTNEVIANAFDELHNDMVRDVKLLAADALSLGAVIYIGAKDERNAAKKRLNRGSGAKNFGLDAEAAEMRKASQRALDKRAKFREEAEIFVQENLGKRFNDDGTHMSKNDLLHQFNETVRNEERLREQLEHSFDNRGHSDSKSNISRDQMAVLGISVASQIVKTNIRDNAEKRDKGTNALTMIENMKQRVDEQISAVVQDNDGYSLGTHSPDEIRIATLDGHETSLQNYILEIFQQHERDNLARQTKKSGEELQRLNPLGPALVEKLMPTVEMIAQYVADGRLDPYALVNLVGDNKIVIHEANGARHFATTAMVEKNIEELLAVMGTHESIDTAQFFADFADPALIQSTLKKNIETLKGEERTFFVALFPDAILEQAGMTKKEIVAERRAGHEMSYNAAAASTLSIAAHDTEMLKKMELSEKQIAAIQILAEQIEAGDEQAIKIAVDGHDKTVLAAIRTVGLHTQSVDAKEEKNFWAKMVEKAKSVPELIAEAKKRREQAPLPEVDESVPLEADSPHFSQQMARREKNEFTDDERPKNFVERASREDIPVGPRSV